MHRSRIGSIGIDCADLEAGVAFWSQALGMEPEVEDEMYVNLKGEPGEVRVFLQKVLEPKTAKTRVHIDIETDDVPAEKARLMALGARQREGCVLEDPCGNEFCVVPIETRAWPRRAHAWSLSADRAASVEDELVVGEAMDESLHSLLGERIYEYNVAATGIHDAGLLSLSIIGPDGALRAGLFGWTWGECLEVDLLWTREDQRGRGLGTRLLLAVEAEACARGCRQVVLDTHSFQAPDFYRKLGYQVYGAVDDYPVGYQKLHLRKELGNRS
jgi:GNAT superfamily N-acetyltransferase